MARTTGRLEQLRRVALRRVKEERIAGRDTRHSRAANLQAIRGLVNGEPHYTFGIKGVERFSFEEVLEAVASITECSSDPNVTTGGGYISPASTLKGLEEATELIARVARQGGKFLLGTGHPGSLLPYYIELVRLICEWGGEVLEPERGALVPPNLDLDYIGGVAVTTDRCSLMHTHDYRAMQLMLEAAGAVDLAVADHGYAGAAVNAGVPVVTMMDTNDPAVAVAKRMGARVAIVPLDDNRPLSAYLSLVDTIRQLGALKEPEEGPARATAVREQALPQGMSDRLRRAERLVAEQAGPAAALDELVLSLLDSYHHQFARMQLEPGDGERLVTDAVLELAIYKQFHDALLRAVAERMRLAQPDCSPGEAVAYLEQSARPADDATLSGA
ncbi:MAG: phosphatase [Chloroflexi bacterium]|nr:phosphatase [Chloroflexota bacterium]